MARVAIVDVAGGHANCLALSVELHGIGTVTTYVHGGLLDDGAPGFTAAGRFARVYTGTGSDFQLVLPGGDGAFGFGIELDAESVSTHVFCCKVQGRGIDDEEMVKVGALDKVFVKSRGVRPGGADGAVYRVTKEEPTLELTLLWEVHEQTSAGMCSPAGHAYRGGLPREGGHQYEVREDADGRHVVVKTGRTSHSVCAQYQLRLAVRAGEPGTAWRTKKRARRT